MAIRYSQIGELVSIMIKQVGRARYEAVLREMKKSQAYLRNQSFRESIDRLERQLHSGKPKPPPS